MTDSRRVEVNDDRFDNADHRRQEHLPVSRPGERGGYHGSEPLQGHLRRDPGHRGGRSGAYEEELRRAKQIAVDEMVEQATALGANAVLGVDLDYETIGVGSGGSMLMVSASGTAVVLEE